MRDIYRIALLAGFLALAAGWQIGCDRLKGTLDANQPPIVEFVNVPLDSTHFIYAPRVCWFGHDPDGLVETYQYIDTTGPEAIQAYEVDSLEAFVANLPPEAWGTPTEETCKTIYLQTEAGEDTTDRILFLRCMDNEGAISKVVARMFSRSNEPPNVPLLTLPDYDGYADFYDSTYTDTFLIGDTLTNTYSGIHLLWTGDDPDDRALITIPLEFSYLIVDTVTNEIIHLPGDTICENGWSKWSSSTTKTLYGLETGWYRFSLKSRDDAYAESMDSASFEFYCIKPTFEHHLLVVDENTYGIPQLGNVDPDIIKAFYEENLREAWSVMNAIYPDCNFVDDGYDYQIFESHDSNGKRIPYCLIHKFKLVWIIDDDRKKFNQLSIIDDRIEVMGNYLDVGGMLMISGRAVLHYSYQIPLGEQNFDGEHGYGFFRQYFNIQSGFANLRSTADTTNNDFNGAIAAVPWLPDLEIDTAKVHGLTWGTKHYDCLPDVDWVGRNPETNTLYYYKSGSADQSYEVYNFDCKVDTTNTTPYYCKLKPEKGSGTSKIVYTRLLSVEEIYNRTKGVHGQFMYFIADNSAFYVSTPTEFGTWQDEDTLEVDFTYIPITRNHLKPTATRFDHYQLEYDFEGGEFNWTGLILFRTSFVGFPLYFIKNDEPFPETGLLPVVHFLAAQFEWFYSRRTFSSEDFEG